MREFTDGSTAIVRGALDAGCTFFAGYPITPASPILMQMMRELPKASGVAIQGEDEISSIGMCIGATLAGARSMTATSGPGLSLYSENIGLAIIGEVPLVIVDVQRLGPATGGATTVGQGDVQFVRWGTAGGYPIIALAPSSVAECYALTRRAFDLAERFRCPVFLLTDKELNMTTTTVEVDSYEKPDVRERSLLAATEPPYRYVPAADVSPLAQYGGDGLVRFTGSTHDERAIITKAPAKVAQLNEHLRAKIEDYADAIELTVPDLQHEDPHPPAPRTPRRHPRTRRPLHYPPLPRHAQASHRSLQRNNPPADGRAVEGERPPARQRHRAGRHHVRGDHRRTQ